MLVTSQRKTAAHNSNWFSSESVAGTEDGYPRSPIVNESMVGIVMINEHWALLWTRGNHKQTAAVPHPRLLFTAGENLSKVAADTNRAGRVSAVWGSMQHCCTRQV